eukprot:1147591-Pelagomonas_calceolata.AAC.1
MMSYERPARKCLQPEDAYMDSHQSRTLPATARIWSNRKEPANVRELIHRFNLHGLKVACEHGSGMHRCKNSCSRLVRTEGKATETATKVTHSESLSARLSHVARQQPPQSYHGLDVVQEPVSWE